MQVEKGNWKNIRFEPLYMIFIISMIQLTVAFLTDPMMLTFDESMWQYIGRNWIRNGMVPYRAE
jgi:hypothetical protein